MTSLARNNKLAMEIMMGGYYSARRRFLLAQRKDGRKKPKNFFGFCLENLVYHGAPSSLGWGRAAGT